MCRIHARPPPAWTRQKLLEEAALAEAEEGGGRRMREYLRTQRPNGPMWQTLGELMDKSSTGSRLGIPEVCPIRCWSTGRLQANFS